MQAFIWKYNRTLASSIEHDPWGLIVLVSYSNLYFFWRVNECSNLQYMYKCWQLLSKHLFTWSLYKSVKHTKLLYWLTTKSGSLSFNLNPQRSPNCASLQIFKTTSKDYVHYNITKTHGFRTCKLWWLSSLQGSQRNAPGPETWSHYPVSEALCIVIIIIIFLIIPFIENKLYFAFQIVKF